MPRYVMPKLKFLHSTEVSVTTVWKLAICKRSVSKVAFLNFDTYASDAQNLNLSVYAQIWDAQIEIFT